MQEAVEHALSAIAGEPLDAVCAGRTDAGVHALGQVVNFDVTARRPLSAWVRGTNSHLPGSVAVTWAQPVDYAFHARFSAVARTYRYLLLNRPQRPGLLRGRAGWYHQWLDVETMRTAAQWLVGEHDFSAFRAAECQAKSPTKRMHSIDVRRHGVLVCFDVCANAFLHHMVRNIVGCLVEVGCGRRSPEWLAQVRDSRDRARAAPTVDAAGLYLSSVTYDPHWKLPACRALLPLDIETVFPS